MQIQVSASSARSNMVSGPLLLCLGGLAVMAANSPPPHMQPQPGTWPGWGAGIYNNRWASSDSSIHSKSASSLKPFCQVNYERSGSGVSAAPLVEHGIAYYPTWSGLLVAINYQTCHIIWQININAVVTAVHGDYGTGSLGAIKSRTTPVADGNVLYIGTLANALLLAIDKSSGRLMDTLQMHEHPQAILTMSPTLHEGSIYIGVSSQEESAANEPGYVCCTFIGTMNAVAFQAGRLKLLWSLPMIPASRPGWSGAAIWGSQPAIDEKRSQLFIATGNTYALPQAFEDCQTQTANITVVQQGQTRDPCLPPDVYQNSILALDLHTGRINWAQQLSPLDAYNTACPDPASDLPPQTDACPSEPGPDADFAIAPTFVLGSAGTPYQLDTVVAAQKNGIVYALNAATGRPFWAKALGPGSTAGGFMWGIAVDDANVYYASPNWLQVDYTIRVGGTETAVSTGAFGAARLVDGSIQWQTPMPPGVIGSVPPTLVNDVVLNGISGNITKMRDESGPGSLLALDKNTGRIVHEYPLNGSYFNGGIVPIYEFLLFGVGYDSAPGSFNVWKTSS